MMESLVQCKLHAGFGGEDAETGVSKGARARCVLTQSLSERRDAYRMVGKSISYYEQKRDLPEIKEIRPEYHDIHSQAFLWKRSTSHFPRLARCVSRSIAR
jgi:hypothetical protein